MSVPSTMQATVPIALFGWLIVVIVLLMTLHPHRVVIVSVLGGYLFLPKEQWTIASGICDWSSNAAICWYTLACALAFAHNDILRLRPAWMGNFVALGLPGWVFSSILAGHGIKQALLDWWFYLDWAVIPYVPALCYLTSTNRFRDLALGMSVAIVVYAPLIPSEVPLNLQLSRLAYGPQLDRGVHVALIDGYRQIVFYIVRGSAPGIWGAASVVVIWTLYLSSKPLAWMNVPIGLTSAVAVLVGLLNRSTGAIASMLGGVATLLANRVTGRRWLALLPSILVVLYLGTGVLNTNLPLRELGVRPLQPFTSAERLQSLPFQFEHEAVLAARARQQLMYGFGGQGESRDVVVAIVRESAGSNRIVTDGVWSAAFGQRGLVRVATVFGWLLVPAAMAIWLSVPAPLAYLMAGLALWSSLYAADLLLNGFVSTVQRFVAGSLASFKAWCRAHAPRRSAAGAVRCLEQNQTRRVTASQHSAPPVWSELQATNHWPRFDG